MTAETLSFGNFENFETDPESEAAAGAAVWELKLRQIKD